MSLSPRDPLVLARVVGDVVDPFMRLISLTVNYGQRQVTNGLDLRTSQVLNKPTVEIGGDDLRNLYTLLRDVFRVSCVHNCFGVLVIFPEIFLIIMLWCPDVPSPSNPHLREYLHWLVTDIPATTGTAFGNELVHYENPCPNSGIHRVALMLSRQLRRQTVYAPEWRQRFNTRAFAENNNLGLPVAAVFFNCQRDNGCGGRRT
ncbi:unnamed protein product [Brassica oleracea]|uniref:Flowering locus T n=1 Tax=Brassica oleracea TaxID=3712 RepID=A0A3P6DRZ7_BRAOL|nr:unnamed protein product [Brassica oleracea]